MTRGDRLGHSWRDGRLLYPGLASDFACMIRAALALYEATGERRYLEQALAWQRALDAPLRQSGQRRLFPHRRRRRGPGGAPGARPATTRRPTRTRSRRKIWCGSRRSPATTHGAQQADRLFDGVLARRGRQPVRPCRAAQRARPAAARRRDRRHRDRDARAEALADGRALKLPFLDRIVLRAPHAARTAAPSHPAQDKIAAAPPTRGFVVRRTRPCSLPVGRDRPDKQPRRHGDRRRNASRGPIRARTNSQLADRHCRKRLRLPAIHRFVATADFGKLTDGPPARSTSPRR